MSGEFQGRRVYPDGDDLYLKPGEYGIHPRAGRWYACTPNGHYGDLANHEVTEHADGTITVSPSILVSGYDNDLREKTMWHGYLEHGVWREA